MVAGHKVGKLLDLELYGTGKGFMVNHCKQRLCNKIVEKKHMFALKLSLERRWDKLVPFTSEHLLHKKAQGLSCVIDFKTRRWRETLPFACKSVV